MDEDLAHLFEKVTPSGCQQVQQHVTQDRNFLAPFLRVSIDVPPFWLQVPPSPLLTAGIQKYGSNAVNFGLPDKPPSAQARNTYRRYTVEPAHKGQRYKGGLTITVKTPPPIEICIGIKVCLAIEYKGGRSCLVTI